MKAKKNPQDLTLRNIRAANKRIKHLEACMRFHRYLIEQCEKRLAKLEKKRRKASGR